MDWRTYIHSDPNILSGQPVVTGTRLTVDFVIGLFAEGWTEQQVLENYPRLTVDALRAVFTYAGPILQLGVDPIVDEVDDASINHDHYLTSR